jgi:hypothetical protein
MPLVLTLAIVFGAAPRPAFAQTAPSDVLGELISQGTVLFDTDQNPSTPGHELHFLYGPALGGVPAALNAAIALQTSDFPIGPAFGTRMYVTDSEGRMTRYAYGGSYAERALPLGRHHVGLGLAFQDATFQTLDDVNLRNGGINFLFGHSRCCAPGDDVLLETVYLRVNRKVTSFLLSYGVTDRLDFGIVVPIAQVTVAGRVASRIIRVDTLADPSLHTFDPVLVATHATYLDDQLDRVRGNSYGVEGRTARGLGDLRLRGKFALVSRPSGGLAVIADLALPTGSSEDFLGTGATRLKSGVVWSGVVGKVSPHVSGAYVMSSGSLSSKLQSADPGRPIDLKVPNEIEWTAGLDAPIAPRTMLIVDTIGRRIRNVQRFDIGSTPFRNDVNASTALVTSTRGDMDQVFSTVGGRFHLGGAVYANATVFFPVLTNGLTPRASAAFTLDYGF